MLCLLGISRGEDNVDTSELENWYLKKYHVERLLKCHRQSNGYYQHLINGKKIDGACYRRKDTNMNPQIHSEEPLITFTNPETATTDVDMLAQDGFTSDEILS